MKKFYQVEQKKFCLEKRRIEKDVSFVCRFRLSGVLSMANLIIICGPQAVGKMTVAESLRDKLKYNMMMNHDSIEISDRIFGFGTPAQKEFNTIFREKAFELAIKHNIDLIFTYVCAFEIPQERAYLTELSDLFTANGGAFYFVELSASFERLTIKSQV